MPDAGRARPQDCIVKLPSPKPEYPPLPWDCEGAVMLNLYFEVLKDALLDRLPPEFNRSTPPYCRLFIVDHPKSPVGRFREATLALGCRLNMMPGCFAAASIADNPRALAAGIFERGFPNTQGTIEFEADGQGARATVSDKDGELICVILPSLQTIEPSRLAYDHVDALRTSPDGSGVELRVTAPDLTIERAAICKNARIEYPAKRPESRWQILRSRNVISAQLVTGLRKFDAAHEPR